MALQPPPDFSVEQGLGEDMSCAYEPQVEDFAHDDEAGFHGETTAILPTTSIFAPLNRDTLLGHRQWQWHWLPTGSRHCWEQHS